MSLCQVNKADKKKKLLELLNDPERDPSERMLVFVNTKIQADFLVSKSFTWVNRNSIFNFKEMHHGW